MTVFKPITIRRVKSTRPISTLETNTQPKMSNILEAILPELQKTIKQINKDHEASIAIHYWKNQETSTPMIEIWHRWKQRHLFITEIMIWGRQIDQQSKVTYCQEDWTDPQLLKKLAQHIKNLAWQSK